MTDSASPLRRPPANALTLARANPPRWLPVSVPAFERAASRRMLEAPEQWMKLISDIAQRGNTSRKLEPLADLIAALEPPPDDHRLPRDAEPKLLEALEWLRDRGAPLEEVRREPFAEVIRKAVSRREVTVTEYVAAWLELGPWLWWS